MKRTSKESLEREVKQKTTQKFYPIAEEEVSTEGVQPTHILFLMSSRTPFSDSDRDWEFQKALHEVCSRIAGQENKEG